MHCTYGYLVLALALTLSVVDTFAAATRLLSYIRSLESGGKFSIRAFWNTVILGKEDRHVFGSNAEYINLVPHEPGDPEENLKSNVHHHRRIVTLTDAESIHEDETAEWVNNVRRHSEDSPDTPASDSTLVGRRFSHGSQHSDDTTQEQVRFTNNIPLSRRLGKLVFTTVERTLVFAGFAQLMHGVVIYTGGCREHYLNGCLAHIISKFRPNLSDIHTLMTLFRSSRGRYLLVLRPFYICPLSWVVLRVWLGVESRTHGPASLSGVRRIICDILLRHHQHMDGAFRRKTWRPLHNKRDPAHQHCRHVLVRGLTRDGP